MFGVSINAFDGTMLVLAVIMTIVACSKKGAPYEKGTQEYLATRLFWTGIALVFWSCGLYIFGFALAAVAFILSIVIMVKGLVAKGVGLMAFTIVMSLIRTFAFFTAYS